LALLALARRRAAPEVLESPVRDFLGLGAGVEYFTGGGSSTFCGLRNQSLMMLMIFQNQYLIVAIISYPFGDKN